MHVALCVLDKTKQIPEGADNIAPGQYLVLSVVQSRSGNAWFNGTCYVDLLNPATVKEFIESSYTPYADRYKKSFGEDGAWHFY